MEITNETVERGVIERRFDLKTEDDIVPGIMWLPENAHGPRPVVLIGHGGTQHKRVPNVLGLARRFVRHLGYIAVAIDAPGHGERVTDQEAADAARLGLQARLQAGRESGQPSPMQMSGEEARAWVERTARGVADWKATVDAIEQLPDVTDGRFGYWGVSMGTAIGLPFVAAEPRIGAAVLGLAGISGRPGADAFEQAARSLTMPILFIFQWNDELMTRESGLALFDTIGSKEKTAHINPGGHVGTPMFERDAAEVFFVRHLGKAV